MGRAVALLIVTLMMISAVSASGCLKKEETVKKDGSMDDGDVIVSKKVVSLGKQGMDHLRSAEKDPLWNFTGIYILRFDSGTADYNDLKEGDIVFVGQTEVFPHGFLGEITDKGTDGKGPYLKATTAPLESAIEKGDIDMKKDFTSGEFTTEGLLGGVSVTRTGGETRSGPLFSIALDDTELYRSTSGQTVTGSGSVSFDLSLDFSLVIEDFSLKECGLDITSTYSSDLKFISGCNADINYKKEIGSITFPDIIIPLGPLPLIITPELSLVIGLDGTFSAGAVIDSIQETQVHTWVGYPDDESHKNYNTDLEYRTPSFGSKCTIKAYLGPELALLIYGVVGPYGSLHGFVKFIGGSDTDEEHWDLYVGLELGAGIKVKALGVTWYDRSWPDLINFTRLIASSSDDISTDWIREDLYPLILSSTPHLAKGPNGQIGAAFVGCSKYPPKLNYAEYKDQEWSFESVDLTDHIFCDLSYSSSGIPKILYQRMNETDGEDRLVTSIASKQTNGWMIENVEIEDEPFNITPVGFQCDRDGGSIIYYTIDKSGSTDYWGDISEDLKAATKQNDRWISKTILPTTNGSISGFDHTLDSDGNECLSFFLRLKDGERCLQYTKGIDGKYQAEMVDDLKWFFSDIAYISSYTRIAVGDSPNILYGDLTGQLRFAYKSQGSWKFDNQIDPERENVSSIFGDTGYSLAIKPDGTPVICYINKDNENHTTLANDYHLKYAEWTGHGWKRAIISEWTATVIRAPGTPSVMVGSDGRPLIVFSDGRHLCMYRWLGGA